MAASDIAVSVRGLSKAYTIEHAQAKHITLAETLLARLRNPFRAADHETFWAVKNVSFEVSKGDVVGIVGRNGAGKSTLLKILSRITEPTAGCVDLYGRVGSLLEVGTGFHAELTGRENIFLNGAILGMARPDIRSQFDAIVDFAGVEQFLDTPVKRYSSGMYVRLAFAVAAHLNPEILIVDEVLAVGDAEFQKKCLGKMKDVSNTGRTILFVSHNTAALETLCSSGLLFRNGELKATGPMSEILEQYLNDASGNQDGRFPLARHPARRKQFASLIQEVRTISAMGLTTARFTSTGAITVELDIVPAGKIYEPRIALAIEDHLGRRVTTAATYFSQGSLPAATEPFTARCHMPELNLGPGRYLISVSVSDKTEGLLDSVDCAAWIDVEWDNAYANGEVHLPVYGPVLSTADWQVLSFQPQ